MDQHPHSAAGYWKCMIELQLTASLIEVIGLIYASPKAEKIRNKSKVAARPPKSA